MTMDPAPMQQTVLERNEMLSSFPQEMDLNNPSGSIPQNTYEPRNYDELFPALPNAGLSSVLPMENYNNWSKSTTDMRIASSVITQVFRIPFEERAKINGNNQFGESIPSRICADITSRTHAHIEISSAKDQSLNFLVTGKSDEVAKAKRCVLEKFQAQARKVVKVPKEHHRFILGKKGKKLHELESMTATKITIPNTESLSDEIIITGTRDSIEKAEHEIRLISDEQSKQASEKLDIPKIYHPFITGANNEKLNELMNEYNVRINVPPPSDMKSEVRVTGEKDGVLACKVYLQKLCKEMEKKCTTVSVEVRKSQHKYVFGPRGTNIQDILRQTGVYVEMPSSTSESDTITLRGPSDKLGSALNMVYEKANSVDSAEIEAPQWLHKFIIGRKGSNIKCLTQDHPKVHVEFSDKSGIIKLEGPPEEVETAKEKLANMVADFEQKLTFVEMTIDPRFFKHIIGKNGTNINRIRSDSNVTINLDVAGDNCIRLEGSREGVVQVKQELEEMVAKLENEKERDIVIDQRFHRNIIGTKGEKIKEIRDRFNQIQISFPDPSGKSDIVKLRGSKEDVDQCYRYLQKMLRELQENNHIISVSISHQFHKFIIGKGGSNVNKIREETSTRIELPTEDSNSDEIIIIGRKENCELARDRIEKIQNEMANVIDSDMIIPAKFHNAIIGAGGKLIQSISEECGGVKIKFPPPESKSDRVTIRGTKEDVNRARTILAEHANEKQISNFTAEVRARPHHHRFLIGRNGANIRKVRDATGARIIFPGEKDTDKELIIIIGKKDAVAKAKEQMEATIRELDKIVEDSMIVDPKHHRHFVAKRAEVLRTIADDYGGVSVSFPRPTEYSNKVTLKGPKEALEAAKLRILEIVSDLDQQVTVEAVIPQKYHRTVMGARGLKVQGINSHFNVQVKFPDKDSGDDISRMGEDANGAIRPQDIVCITGRKEDCEAAKKALLELIPITLEIPVAFKHHRYIIGQKGETVRSLMSEHDVNIQVPPAQEESDIIRVTGTRTNVESAKAALEDKVGKLEKDEMDRLAKSFHVKLDVDPEYHPKIIGKRGVNVTKIRDKYDVNIQFPGKGDPDERTIVITGYKENVTAAKEHIMSVIGDYDSMVKLKVDIDPRVHPRLIGAKGRAIKRIMEKYKVEIKFPRGDTEPSAVFVIGSQEAVEDCCDHLLNLEEEYLQDIQDEEYLPNNRELHAHAEDASNGRAKEGFVVTNAPWTNQTAPNVNSSEDFPSMSRPSHAMVVTPPTVQPWGPRR